MMRVLSAASVCALLAACGTPGPPPVLPADITDFRALFAANCSGCHGPEGREGPAPPLNNALYLRLVPREEMQHTIENGRGTLMPAFARLQGGPLYPKQIAAIVNGIEQNWAKPVDLEGAALPPYSAPAGDANQGHALFDKVCARCHGPNGSVGPVVTGSLLALVSDQSLRTTIIVGRPLFGMPDWRHQEVVGGLKEQDISNLVAWLASNRPATANPASNSSANTTPEKHQ